MIHIAARFGQDQCEPLFAARFIPERQIDNMFVGWFTDSF